MAQNYSQDGLALIEGADGDKKEEVDYLSGFAKKDGDVWDNFYERFKEIKDYHRKVA
jgi:splicing factor 3A subunit 3